MQEGERPITTKMLFQSAALVKLVRLTPLNLATWQKLIYLACMKPATCVICHVSCVTCHVSLVTWHLGTDTSKYKLLS